MARKSEGEAKKGVGRKLLQAARKHQDALQAAGLHLATIDGYENALRGLEEGGRLEEKAAVVVLVREVQRAVGEFQSAIKKEFPGNASFQAFFRAREPMPAGARAVLALGREVAAAAPDFSANLIRYAINGAQVKHLGYLCDQLEKELGGADPGKAVGELEEQILAVARRAFEGKPELTAFVA